MNQKTTARVRIHAVAVLGSRLPARFVSVEQQSLRLSPVGLQQVKAAPLQARALLQARWPSAILDTYGRFWAQSLCFKCRSHCPLSLLFRDRRDRIVGWPEKSDSDRFRAGWALDSLVGGAGVDYRRRD